MKTCAIGFDIDHTLCIDNKLERVAFLHLLDRVIEEGGDALGSLAQEAEHIDELLAFARSGGGTIEEAVRRFVLERGVTPAQEHVDGFKRMALAMAESFIVPDPHARSTIASLERMGITVAVLSNGWNPLQVAKARRAGFGGRVIASADLGVQKPDPAAFAALADELGVDPARCFYVGDDPRADVGGALAAGFRAVWLDHEGKSYPPGLPAPTFVVHALAEVLTLVATEAGV
ncbi:MAG TPA: HAD family hydrolase [Candidatus Acidoferrales bacterium]|nr:HAD family hydrolase [Candidatus Acidoferrales bacterium]